MTDSSQSHPSVPKLSGSEARTLKKNLRRERLAKDYPDSFRLLTPNQMIGRERDCLTPKGRARMALGLTDEDMKDVPVITPKIREAVGSVGEAISILRGDDSEDSIKFISKWDSLSKTDRKEARFEDVIVASGLTARRFMELLAGANFENSAIVSKIFASHSQIKVLKSTVKAATDEVPITAWDAESGTMKVVGHSNGDVKAMEIFHKITGALPTPKSATFTLNQQINPPTEAPRAPLQSMDSWLLEIDDIRKPKQLPPEIPVEMPDRVPEIEYLEVK